VHVQFGEAQALLAGDALQALAFECCCPRAGRAGRHAGRLARLLARASGAQGMAGGQAIDLASVGKPLTKRAARHAQLKTGALLQASVAMGAACAPQARAAARPRWATMARRWAWPSRWWTTSWT
jgi:farnesyl diphosphate synthase